MVVEQVVRHGVEGGDHLDSSARLKIGEPLSVASRVSVLPAVYKIDY